MFALTHNCVRGARSFTLVRVRKIKKLVFIVARDHEDLFASLRRTLSGDDMVDVIMDRRLAERRRQSSSPAPERRRKERRSSHDVQRRLRARGYAVVSILAVKNDDRR